LPRSPRVNAQKDPVAMTEVQDLARFVERARLRDMSDVAVEQLKIRVLDTSE
jgi:2-methylcitrate dehydratase PrpD